MYSFPPLLRYFLRNDYFFAPRYNEEFRKYLLTYIPIYLLLLFVLAYLYTSVYSFHFNQFPPIYAATYPINQSINQPFPVVLCRIWFCVCVLNLIEVGTSEKNTSYPILHLI